MPDGPGGPDPDVQGNINHALRTVSREAQKVNDRSLSRDLAEIIHHLAKAGKIRERLLEGGYDPNSSKQH